MAYQQDPGTKAILDQVYPDLRVRILKTYTNVFENLGLLMRSTSGFRSMEEQKKLWKIGRDENGKEIPGAELVTKSAPGSSWHEYGLAVDTCWRGIDPFMDYLQQRDGAEATKRWYEFGRYAEGNGLTWGGKFHTISDKPHCQKNYGLTIDKAQELYKSGGLEKVWGYCNSVVRGSK